MNDNKVLVTFPRSTEMCFFGHAIYSTYQQKYSWITFEKPNN